MGKCITRSSHSACHIQKHPSTSSSTCVSITKSLGEQISLRRITTKVCSTHDSNDSIMIASQLRAFSYNQRKKKEILAKYDKLLSSINP